MDLVACLEPWKGSVDLPGQIKKHKHVVGVMLVVAFYFSLGGRAIVKAETLDG